MISAVYAFLTHIFFLYYCCLEGLLCCLVFVLVLDDHLIYLVFSSDRPSRFFSFLVVFLSSVYLFIFVFVYVCPSSILVFCFYFFLYRVFFFVLFLFIVFSLNVNSLHTHHFPTLSFSNRKTTGVSPSMSSAGFCCLP